MVVSALIFVVVVNNGGHRTSTFPPVVSFHDNDSVHHPQMTTTTTSSVHGRHHTTVLRQQSSLSQSPTHPTIRRRILVDESSMHHHNNKDNNDRHPLSESSLEQSFRIVFSCNDTAYLRRMTYMDVPTLVHVTQQHVEDLLGRQQQHHQQSPPDDTTPRPKVSIQMDLGTTTTTTTNALDFWFQTTSSAMIHVRVVHPQTQHTTNVFANRRLSLFVQQQTSTNEHHQDRPSLVSSSSSSSVSKTTNHDTTTTTTNDSHDDPLWLCFMGRNATLYQQSLQQAGWKSLTGLVLQTHHGQQPPDTTTSSTTIHDIMTTTTNVFVLSMEDFVLALLVPLCIVFVGMGISVLYWSRHHSCPTLSTLPTTTTIHPRRRLDDLDHYPHEDSTILSISTANSGGYCC